MRLRLVPICVLVVLAAMPVEAAFAQSGNRAPTACYTVSPAAPQTGQTVTFNSSCSSDPDGSIAARAWDLDNDGQYDDSNATTVTRTFTTAGTYTIRLGVMDNRGAIDTEIKTITVANRAPTANFSFSPAAPTTGQAVTFTSSSTDPDGTIAAQAWDLDNDGQYDDGTTASVSRTFTTPGTRSVKLQVTDNNGTTATVTKSVAVANRPPTANFSFNPPTPITGQIVTFTSSSTDPDGTIASQRWALDDDSVFDDGTAASVTKRFNTPGTFAVRLEVTDSNGATATVTKSITVANRAPNAAFTFSPTAPGSGDPVTFTSTATDADGRVASQRWALDADGVFNDGTATSVTRTFTRAGTYNVKLEVTDDRGATHTVTRPVAIGNRAPTSAFTYAPGKPVAGSAVTLTSTATDPDGDIDAYAWDLDDDGQYDDGTAATASFTPSAARSYIVGLQVTDNSGGQAESEQTIAVGPRPAAPSPAVPRPNTPAAPGRGFDDGGPVVPPAPPAQPTARFISPFPTVRMRGRTTSRGAKLTLFSVRGPHGALARVQCSGRGCPAKNLRKRITTKNRRGARTVRFKRLERLLRVGVTLRVTVTQQGMVGKYTRIRIRRLKLPVRVDRCVMPGSSRPAACPEAP
jgi:PKD repeat protein